MAFLRNAFFMSSADAPRGLPGGIAIDAESYEIREDGTYVLDGGVALSWKATRIQADHIVIREQRYVEAAERAIGAGTGRNVPGDSAYAVLKDGLVRLGLIESVDATFDAPPSLCPEHRSLSTTSTAPAR